jgi:hypothetical protein
MTEVAGAAGEARSGDDPSASRGVVAVVLAALLAPFGVLVVWATTRVVPVVSDVALTEIAVRDVGGAHTPLLGVYSRFGWRHPGPALFYALVGPYRVLGRDGSALAVGALLIGGVALVATLWLLWRRGGAGGVVVGGAVIALLLHGLTGQVLASPWNPHVVVLPMLLFVVAVWSVLCRDRWALPLVAGAGAFISQAHVGSAGVVAVGTVAALIAAVTARGDDRVGRRVWILTVVIAVLAWLPPVIDAFVHDGGNLRDLLDFWRASHAVTGWSHAARIVGAELAVDAPWITGHFDHPAFSGAVEPGWTLPVIGIVFIAALGTALRARAADAVRLGWVTIGFAVVAIVSTARIVGDPYDYLVRWTGLLGVLAVLTVGWTVLALLRATGDARRSLLRGSGVVLASAVVGLSILTSVDAWHTDRAPGVEDRVSLRLLPELDRIAPTLRGPVLVRAHDDFVSWALGGAVVNRMLADGVDARFPRSEAHRVGGQHVVAAGAAATQLVVWFGDDSDRLRADPRARVLASVDELHPGDRAELERLRGNFSNVAAAGEWMRAHPALGRRLTALTARSGRVVVYAVRR